LMKKVMIVASTELEPFLVKRLSETGKFQFHEVPPKLVEGYEGLFKPTYNYEDLPALNARIKDILKLVSDELNPDSPLDKNTLREFAFNPEEALKETIAALDDLSTQLAKVKEPYDKALRGLNRKLAEIDEQYQSEREKISRQILLNRAKKKLLEALDPSQLKECLTAGVVKKENKLPLEALLDSEEISYKVEQLTETEYLVFIFGPEDLLERVNNTFIVYDVEDIYEVFAGELLLVLDEARLRSVIEEYSNRVIELEKKLSALEEKHIQTVKETKSRYASDIESIEKKFKAEFSRIIQENQGRINAALFIAEYLEKYSNVPVLRNPVVSILYGWVDDKDLPAIRDILDELREENELIYKIENVSPAELKESKKGK